MASCKDCIHDEDCGMVMEEHAEKCEVYVNNLVKADEEQQVKLSEIESTTLKIKAAAYDVIKEIIDENMKMDFSTECCFDMVGGVVLMEEAVTKALVK